MCIRISRHAKIENSTLSNLDALTEVYKIHCYKSIASVFYRLIAQFASQVVIKCYHFHRGYVTIFCRTLSHHCCLLSSDFALPNKRVGGAVIYTEIKNKRIHRMVSIANYRCFFRSKTNLTSDL